MTYVYVNDSNNIWVSKPSVAIPLGVAKGCSVGSWGETVLKQFIDFKVIFIFNWCFTVLKMSTV